MTMGFPEAVGVPTGIDGVGQETGADESAGIVSPIANLAGIDVAVEECALGIDDDVVLRLEGRGVDRAKVPSFWIESTPMVEELESNGDT